MIMETRRRRGALWWLRGHVVVVGARVAVRPGSGRSRGIVGGAEALDVVAEDLLGIALELEEKG